MTEINNLISVYGSISYLGKKHDKIAEIVSSSNRLEFNVKKTAVKSYLNIQLAKVNGTKITLIDKKIHRFSITKTGKKRKRQYMDPLETLIIREQQRFELLIQLNPVQVTINDHRILNIKKNKHSY